jgi:predicted nucleic acid-binding Zn ribbon protein
MARPQPIDAVIAGVLRSAKEKHAALSAIRRQWPSLVGKGLAAHTRPVSLRRGRLIVEADRPGDGFALRYRQPQLLERLRGAGRERAVEEIVIRPGTCRT